MQEKVYHCLAENPDSSVDDIAKKLGSTDTINVLETVQELEKEGFVKMSQAFSLAEDNKQSCRYSITDKPFKE